MARQRAVAWGSLALVAILFAWLGLSGAPEALADSKVTTSHGLSIHGDLKYGPGFKHFDYVNPDAPKGGDVRLAAIGTFDSLNPFILKGVPAAGIGRDRSTRSWSSSPDEPFSRVRADRREHRDAGRPLVGRLHAAPRGALPRRQRRSPSTT